MPANLRNRAVHFAAGSASGAAVTTLCATFTGAMFYLNWGIALTIAAISALSGIPGAILNPSRRVTSTLVGGATALIITLAYLSAVVARI